MHNTGAIYDTYAAIYDATGQGRFGAYLAHLSLTWLRARGIVPLRALDLACGTGGATIALAAAGITVVGLDRSPAMLRIAQGRARDAGFSIEFVEADMRELGMVNTELFSLLTCFGDSLNYLTEDGDLQRVFAGAARILQPEGHLVFDVNTEAAFARWDERDVVTYESDACLVYNRLEFRSASRLGRGRIVWFVRDDDWRWWRGEEIHTERAWSDAEIRMALEETGFDLAARLDAEGHAVPDAAALPERLIYLARWRTGGA